MKQLVKRYQIVETWTVTRTAYVLATDESEAIDLVNWDRAVTVHGPQEADVRDLGPRIPMNDYERLTDQVVLDALNKLPPVTEP